MTSELRPAVEVLFEALVKWDDHSDWDYVTKYREAAAIIEADREAVRQQTVEQIVEWLRSDKIVLSMDGSAEDVVASAIEAGEHLK